MWENCESKLQITSSNVLFCPQIKDIPCTVIEEERKHLHIYEAVIKRSLFKKSLKPINRL